MKIFITGASGFIGYHLVQFFLERGVDITINIRGNLKDTFNQSVNTYTLEEKSIEDDIIFFKKNKFDGVISISVWSHHGSTACRNLFEEVHRILKPGGWFLFTAHGPRSIYYYANSERYRSKGLERWISIYEGLLQNYHVFEQVWMIDDDAGNNANDWGNFYVKPEWIITNLAENFFPKLYYRGANQRNQDLYIFQKKF